jgi:hypothetical protein
MSNITSFSFCGWDGLKHTKIPEECQHKMEKKASLMKIAGAHLTISWTADNVEQVNALIYGNRLVTVTDIATSTATFGITKPVEGACQSILRWTETCVKTQACVWNMHAISAVISWWGGFCAVDCHKWWNVGAPLWIWQQMLNHGVESHAIAQDKKKFQSVHSASKVMLTLFWDINGPILWIMDTWSIAHSIVLFLKRR